MKTILIFCLFLSLQVTHAQKVEVSGIVKTSHKRGNVLIVLNDTLKKLPKNFPDSLYNKIWENKELVNSSNDEGNFSFRANPNDSLVFSDFDHISKTVKVSEILAKKGAFQIILEPVPCVEYIPCEEPNPELYMFIGSKIAVDYASQPNYCGMVSLDSKRHAKYKILEKYSSNVTFDTIEFSSYSHSAKVRFDEYQNVFLYVRTYCGEQVQEKYKFHAVYRTKDGKWATPVVEEYDATRRKKINKPPRKVRMAEPIIVPDYQSYKKIEEVYTKPYFKIKKGKVYMVYGYYPEDLINM